MLHQRSPFAMCLMPHIYLNIDENFSSNVKFMRCKNESERRKRGKQYVETRCVICWARKLFCQNSVTQNFFFFLSYVGRLILKLS